MSTKMTWGSLLSNRRIGSALRKSVLDRPDFQRDVDKLAFSAPFRRLQGKLQVHTRTQDFARNRMTHSLEVSRVGKTLGRIIAEFIDSLGELPADMSPHDVSDIMEAACLAHDIGTPPAAHLGEDVIRDFFESDLGTKLLGAIPQAADFLSWEGNAQGFRFLTRETGENGGPGLGLTMATVAATVKYPCTSDLMNPNAGAHRKKFNIFRDDEPMFVEIANHLGLLRENSGSFVRHPLAFLVEAADDICYTIVDLEDAWRLGFLSDVEVLSLYERVIDGSEESEISSRKCQSARSAMEKISCMRGFAISALVHACIHSFKANYETIMSGRFTSELLLDEASTGSEIPNAILAIKRISKERIYARRDVNADIQDITHAMTTILDLLGSELLALEEKPRKRMSLLAMRYPGIFDRTITSYQRLLRMTDMIACLSEDGLLEEAGSLESLLRKRRRA